jgi:hypothetical protein
MKDIHKYRIKEDRERERQKHMIRKDGKKRRKDSYLRIAVARCRTVALLFNL